METPYEEMVLEGIPAWKTKVEFQKIRRAEGGDLTDKEKALHRDAAAESPERAEVATDVKA